MTLPCIVCDKKLAHATVADTTVNLPWGANIFKSYGHYGATAFDNLRDEYLEVNICTACLETAAESGRVYLVKPGYQAPPPASYILWRPDSSTD